MKNVLARIISVGAVILALVWPFAAKLLYASHQDVPEHRVVDRQETGLPGGMRPWAPN